MNQEHLNSHLQILERKISILLGNHKALKKELEDLKSKNEELKKLVGVKEEQINDFQNRIKISKIVDAVGADKEYSAGLKIKLNEYIKDIDRCIVQLST